MAYKLHLQPLEPWSRNNHRKLQVEHLFLLVRKLRPGDVKSLTKVIRLELKPLCLPPTPLYWTLAWLTGFMEEG